VKPSLLCICLFVLAGTTCATDAIAKNQKSLSDSTIPPTVSRASWDVAHDVSPPLSTLVGASATPVASAKPTGQEAKSSPVPNPLNPGTGLSIVRNFPGFAAPGGPIPNVPASDTSGAAGPNHYVQAVNFAVTIYDKNGNIVSGPFSTAAWWNGFSFSACAAGLSDEIIMYDHEAQRWMVTRFARTANPDGMTFTWYQCFAVSTTTDPTGSFNRYVFQIDPSEFNDYPKFGIWPDGYYMTADRNKIFPGLGVFAAVFERDKMLNNLPAQSFVFKIDNGGLRAGMLPADWDGATAPPAGSPDYFVRTLDPNIGWPNSAIEIWALHVDWANSSATFGLQDTLTPDPFSSNLCGLDQSCVPQPGTPQGLDPQAGGRPMFRLAYRSFGDHEAMILNQAVDAADFANHSAIRWYELRRTGSAWSIYQQNTFAPDSDHRWMGTASLDRFGNMAIGYNVSSASTFPSLRVAARLATDAVNTLTEEFTLQAGSGSYTGTSQFADYSQMVPDPLDDCTLWFTGTYQPVTSNQYTWATQIGAFRFPSCAADLAVTKSVSAATVDAGTNVTYTVTLTNNGPADAGNVTVTDNIPFGLSFVSLTTPAGWNCSTPAPGGTGIITCTKTSVLDGESDQFTVVATVKCSVPNNTVINNTASATEATPVDNNPNNDSASASFAVHNPVPVVTASVGLNMLRQNNHNLVNVGLAATVTDGTCPAPSMTVQVVGDEDDQSPTGANENFSPDAKDIAVGTLRLRAERVGNLDGRVYLIVVSATDQTGGTGFATATVVVPKSQSAASIASVKAQAAAAKAYADSHNGAPPPAYFVIGDGPVIGPKQ
jgi:uncharacterized repeat protein (TIGR01451 family)